MTMQRAITISPDEAPPEADLWHRAIIQQNATGEWSLSIVRGIAAMTVNTRHRHGFPVLGVPTWTQRDEVLRTLGWEVVGDWRWREYMTPVTYPVADLTATADLRRIDAGAVSQ